MNNDSFINETLKNTILENQPGTFFRRRNDDKQTFLKVSKNWENLAGYSNEDLKSNNSFYESIFNEDRELVLEGIKKSIVQKNQWKLNYRIITKDGLTKWIEEIGIPIFDDNDNLLFLEGYISEIINGNSVTHQELVFKNAVYSTSIVSITDKVGKIISVNDLFCYHSKYTKEELIGQNHQILNSGHHPKEFFTDLWKTILNKKVWRGEIKNRAKDGTYYWVDTLISPVFNDQGEIEQFLSIRNIITEKKQNEFLLKSIYDGLTVKTGENFFSNLTSYCCKSLGVDYCFVGWYNESVSSIETIAVSDANSLLNNFTYKLENTPCANVINKNVCSIPQSVQNEFPKDDDLVKMNIEAYLGIPILDENKKILGLIVLLNKTPLFDAFDKEFILSAVASRIGNELTKFLLEKDKKQFEEYTENLLSSMGSQICVMHESGEILILNKVSDILSLANNKIDLRTAEVGSNYMDLLSKTIKQTSDVNALEIYNGIEAILNNQMNDFQVEFPSHGPDEQRYFLLSVTRFVDSSDKLVLSQIEITKSKKHVM